MQVSAVNAVNLVAERAPVVSLVTPPLRAPISLSAATTAAPTSKSGQRSKGPEVNPEPLLTFRRDRSGRSYYLITDAQSGKELAQLPPESFRNIGEGIESYLKQEQARNGAGPHIQADA
jgi:hypothetical protein